jgi:hypothetical protein
MAASDEKSVEKLVPLVEQSKKVRSDDYEIMKLCNGGKS